MLDGYMLFWRRQAGFYVSHAVIIILNMVYVHCINLLITIWSFLNDIVHITVISFINSLSNMYTNEPYCVIYPPTYMFVSYYLYVEKIQMFEQIKKVNKKMIMQLDQTKGTN